ncbi:tubulin domain-containing protein [Peziza echinospora]|nr:tubulin domain-containing protein [Peziza echinospora]
MHEIVTLQLGHSANHVATHFWNTQQSYFTYAEDEAPKPINHDVHFRAGVGAGGVETYTPRTVVYDLKGGFGSLRKINALYEIDEDMDDKARAGNIWDKPVVVQKEPEIEMSPYVKGLEYGTPTEPLTADKVRYWSDFNGVYYHPRSMVQLYQYEVNSSITPFENHQLGVDLFNTIDKEHDILDRDLRFFAEECDYMQGIQLITTTDDGWGGFASSYLAALRDEFPKTEIWTWGIQRGEKVPFEKRIPRTIALANALSAMVPLSSIYVPIMCPPAKIPSYAELDRSSLWHNSALISTAIETLTLQTRLKDRDMTKMAELSVFLNTNGSRNIASLGMSAFGDPEQDDLPANKKVSDSMNLSWRGAEKHVFANMEVSRGQVFKHLGGITKRTEYGEEEEVPESHSGMFGWLGCESGGGFIPPTVPSLYFFIWIRHVEIGANSFSKMVREFHTDLPFPILDSYPKIFPNVTDSLSVSSTLRTSSAVLEYMGVLKETVMRYCPVDDRENLYNELSGLSSVYHEGWDSDSDSGDDE